jgi:predicted RNA-binding Zn-ribbon protein involved in translation (DUF1610 family)
MGLRGWILERKQLRALDKIAGAINSGCSYETAISFRCPSCGGQIAVYFNRSGRRFIISCISPAHDFVKNYECTSPPTWWKDHATALTID